jgi:hypothetical protein
VGLSARADDGVVERILMLLTSRELPLKESGQGARFALSLLGRADQVIE